MKQPELNFVDKFVRGQVKLEEILNYIANWHEMDHDICLTEFLGLSHEEHLAFVEDDKALRPIMEAKKVAYRRGLMKVVITEKEEKSA